MKRCRGSMANSRHFFTFLVSGAWMSGRGWSVTPTPELRGGAPPLSPPALHRLRALPTMAPINPCDTRIVCRSPNVPHRAQKAVLSLTTATAGARQPGTLAVTPPLYCPFRTPLPSPSVRPLYGGGSCSDCLAVRSWRLLNRLFAFG